MSSKIVTTEATAPPVTTPKAPLNLVGEERLTVVRSVKANPWNPNKMTHFMQASLEQEIALHGWLKSMLILVWGKDEKGVVQNLIIDGEHRWVVAKRLKIETIPMVFIDGITESEAKKLTIKIGQKQGAFDPENLSVLLRELQGEMDLGDYAIDMGFPVDQLQDMFKLEVRTGEPIRGRATDQLKKGGWKEADTFYAMPEWLSPMWEKAKTIIVEFSGGKDSTAAAIWAAAHKEGKEVILSFVDPGVEFPGITAHVMDVANFFGTNLEIVKPKIDWWITIAHEGWPNILYRPCATNFIHKPWAEFVKKHDPETTIVLTGSRAEEANAGSPKTERSPLSSLGKMQEKFQHFAPCFAITKPIEERIIAESGVPLWEGYSRGFVRTACWCCPGQCGLQAAALQKNYPGLCDDIRRWEKRIGMMVPTSGRSFDDKLRAGLQKLERAERLKEKGIVEEVKVKTRNPKTKNRTK
jgi:3'-phosphoadenosine 5'-phosphosulfate sulfotransferase (PAPS reductase)/FAD synthetase